MVFFTLPLVMVFEDIRSERQLIETTSLHLAHRWSLGYALDEALPDHSSLTRIRQRLGVNIFQRFFERIVDRCQEAGVLWGAELFFDATKVRADAAGDSPVPRFYYEAKPHLDAVVAGDAGQTAESRPIPRTCCRTRWGHSLGNATTDRRSQPNARGGCWRSGGWTRTGLRSAPPAARPTSG